MDQNQAKMDQNVVHFGLANAKIQFRIRSFRPKMVVWTILDHFGPVHCPTVPQPLLISESTGNAVS